MNEPSQPGPVNESDFSQPNLEKWDRLSPEERARFFSFSNREAVKRKWDFTQGSVGGLTVGTSQQTAFVMDSAGTSFSVERSGTYIKEVAVNFFDEPADCRKWKIERKEPCKLSLSTLVDVGATIDRVTIERVGDRIQSVSLPAAEFEAVIEDDNVVLRRKVT